MRLSIKKTELRLLLKSSITEYVLLYSTIMYVCCIRCAVQYRGSHRICVTKFKEFSRQIYQKDAYNMYFYEILQYFKALDRICLRCGNPGIMQNILCKALAYRPMLDE